MRIAYCIPSCYNSGGMERVLSLKANYLADKMDYEVFIITTGQKNNKPYYPLSPKIQLIDLGINYSDIEHLPLYKKIHWVFIKRYKHRKLLSRTLYQLKADIVISMFTHELPFLYKIKDGSSKVLEIHFSQQFRTLHNLYNHANWIVRLLGCWLNHRDQISARKYDRFVVLTREDKATWKNFSNIEVIYNPTTFIPSERADYRSKKAIAVGRLCAQKGFDMLINIWNSIDKKSRCGWSLSIYGSGPDNQSLHQQIKSLGLETEIEIYPPTCNIAEVYKNSSILCFTSRYEGFGMVVVEAMSFGVVPISFDCPCGPKDIIANGSNGILIRSFDQKEFASKLAELMNNENQRKQMGENAITSIQEKFEISSIMKQWVNLFQSLRK